MTSTVSRMISGSAWLSGARAVTNGLSFISTVVLARILVPADFGLVAICTTMLAIISSVTSMSMSQALISHRNPTDEHLHAAWSVSLVRGLVIAAILCASAKPVSWAYADYRIEYIIYSLALGAALGAITNPKQALLNKNLVYHQDFIILVTNRVVSFLCSVAIAIAFRSYWALILGTIFGQIVSVIVSYSLLPYRPRFSFKHARELWSFSIWLTLGDAMNTLNWRFDQLMVGQVLGQGALGIYSVGSNLSQMPTRESTMPLRQTLYPALTKVTSDPARLRRAFQRAQTLITFVALPMGVGFAVIAEPFVEAALGRKWLSAVPIIQALASVFALQTLGSVVQPLGMALKQTKLLFRRDFQMFFVRLPIIIGSMVVWGMPGLIYSRVVTGLLASMVNMALVRQLCGLSIGDQVRVNLRSIAAVCLMAAGVLAFQQTWNAAGAAGELHLVMEIAGSVLVGAVVYAGSAFLMWKLGGKREGPEAELLSMLPMLRAKLRKSSR